MADANTYLKVTELDFDGIKNNLKTYLSARPEFKDYNFEGSTIGTLIDVLAYNTHYNSYYANMLANEMFLDTAQQRDSIVSRARELGYLPGSSKGSQANIKLTFLGVPAEETRITLRKNTSFTTVIDNVAYTYVLPETVIIDRDATGFSKIVQIKEGTALTHRVTYSAANKTKIVVPNVNVDAGSVRVRVQNSSADATVTEFTRATNISTIKETSPIFFIEEAPDGKYEIIFGSGSLGKPLKDDNIVIVDYLVNNGADSDGAKLFSAKSILLDASYTSINIETVDASFGGAARESIESIKFNAPRMYQTQNRAVVAEDFERILLTEQGDLESVVAFGGEQADPPVPGTVYIAVKPTGELFMTVQRKSQIKQSIASRTMLSIEPIIVDAEYLYLIPNITTYYNKDETTLKSGDIKELVLSQVDTFSEKNLERFGNKMRFSRFLRNLDNLDGSIINNEAVLEVQKRFTPTTQRTQKITLKYNNAIRRNSLTSTEFTYSGYSAYLNDDGNGNINVFRYADNKETVIVPNTGNIDYETGVVNIENFQPTAFSGIEIKVNVKPEKTDVTPVREQILIMDSRDSNVTVIGE